MFVAVESGAESSSTALQNTIEYEENVLHYKLANRLIDGGN